MSLVLLIYYVQYSPHVAVKQHTSHTSCECAAADPPYNNAHSHQTAQPKNILRQKENWSECHLLSRSKAKWAKCSTQVHQNRRKVVVCGCIPPTFPYIKNTAKAAPATEQTHCCQTSSTKQQQQKKKNNKTHPNQFV